MDIPPFLFYAIGATLIVFGAWRAYQLGFRGRRGDVEAEESPARRRARKRHIAMGIVWVVMGGYVVWTAVALERRLAEGGPADGEVGRTDDVLKRGNPAGPSRGTVRMIRAEPVITVDAGS